MVERPDWRHKMVEVSILLEGGVNVESNANADTFDNSERLRESFQRLLSSGLRENEEIKIRVDTKGSYTSVLKLKSHLSSTTLALLDLDADASHRERRIEQYGLSGYEEFVFFMIQAMESWILSQPEAIEKTFEDFTRIEQSPLADDPIIKGINCESIEKPDKKLNTLLSKYFQREKGGRIKPLKYGKLNNSYSLIEKLDIDLLKGRFQDVDNLLNKIKALTLDA
ncbi:DUF4276 family protein [Pseudarcicella hirudinis]|uniref:DUF4276 family protein n=1 Tax=Pseudarcicella hirudinis TaxID=1079859 RepID=UPI0011600E7C|nr:DUF4276 family protein [Pseudarcicella hirudinis]